VILLKMETSKLVVLLTSFFLSQISALSIESAIGIVAVPMAAYLGSKFYCQIEECCTDKWLAIISPKTCFWTTFSHKDRLKGSCRAFE